MALVNLQQISQQWKDSGKPQLTQSKSFVKCDCRDEAAYLSKGILKYFRTEANKKKMHVRLYLRMMSLCMDMQCIFPWQEKKGERYICTHIQKRVMVYERKVTGPHSCTVSPLRVCHSHNCADPGRCKSSRHHPSL